MAEMLPRPICWLLLVAVHFVSVSVAEAARLLVRNAQLLTMVPGQEAPFIGYMVVGDDGRIASIAPGDPPADVVATWTFDAAGKVVIPGFVSGHSHLWQSPFRGIAADEDVLGWLQALQGTLAYRGFMIEGDMYAFNLHGALDFVRHGVTAWYNYCARNRNFTPAIYDEQFTALLDSGGRFMYGYVIPAHGTMAEAQEAFDRFRTVTRSHAEDPTFLGLAIATNGLRVGADFTRFEFTTAQAHGLPVQMHYLEAVAGQQDERDNFRLFEELGGPWPWLMFAHFVQTDDRIIAAAGAKGAAMIWNPLSNGRLATGLADIKACLAAGMKVGMGIDGQASADISDPFENMRMGLYQLRMRHKSAAVMQPYDVLRMHTLGTAEAMGVDDRIGSLAPGKLADFLVVDPADMDTGSVTDVHATLVFACSIANLEWVFVGGEPVARRGILLRHDMRAVTREAHARVAALRERAKGAVPGLY